MGAALAIMARLSTEPTQSAVGFFDGVPLAWLGDASGWGVAAALAIVFVRLIYTGGLVPRITADRDREALAAERETNAELRAAVLEYMAIARTAVHALEAIQPDSQDGDRS